MEYIDQVYQGVKSQFAHMCKIRDNQIACHSYLIRDNRIVLAVYLCYGR